jgi:hypothetical protein
VKVDGIEISEESIREELRNICENYPVWPGDAISHRTAKACVERGWVKRDDGHWVPTATGLMANDD